MHDHVGQAFSPVNSGPMRLHKPELVHEQRVLLMALISGSPAVITSMIILWWPNNGYTSKVQWTLSVLIVGVWLGFCFALREHVASPLRTLANLLEAMREGDYSIRARGDTNRKDLPDAVTVIREDALGD